MKKTRINIQTLGCSKNSVDTEHLMAMLPEDAFEFVGEGEKADIQLVNTCGFIGDAKEESVQAVLSQAARKPSEISCLVVFGCLSQRYEAELKAEIPEVDAWFGARDLAPVAAYCLERAGAKAKAACERRRLETTGLPYAYLKISEGCDRRCSYCAIPLIRGPYRSVPMEDLVAEAGELASKGIRELIVIAQDTTCYGLDLYGRRALAELLTRLSEIGGIEWIRLHYSYPASFPEDVLEVMASNLKVCKYLDIPLQHISDTILSDMHRGVDSGTTRKLIRTIRSKVPGIVLRTTMICGYPGESEADFRQLLDFVSETRFERLGAFTYSSEEGTSAGDGRVDGIPAEVKQERYDALMELQSSISLGFNRSRVGEVERVLVDSVSQGKLVCRSQYESPDVDGEIMVEGVSEPEKLVGQFIDVRITEAGYYDLKAVAIEDCSIDIGRVVADKFGGKGLPGPFVAFLRRFIHEDLLNGMLRKGYMGIEFCNESVKYLDVKIEVEGLENLDGYDGSRLTFASNHPLGGIDGIALGGIIGSRYGDVRMLVNDFLMALKGLAPLCVPINKTGGQSRDLPRLIDGAFRSEAPMMVFPAGLCSRRKKGVIKDLPWGKAFIRKSVETRRDIVPVHFIGRNSNLFYRAAQVSDALKAKFNFAMAFLPGEVAKARGKTFRIIFGKPIPYTRFDDSLSSYQWAQWVKEEVYKL